MINLNSKNSLATKSLAKEFISLPINSRIKTITDYSSIIGVARGTIQNSIKLMRTNGALEIKSKGHLGSFLVYKDLHLLLAFADIKFLVGVMPLPYSKKYEGLSHGILKSLEDKLSLPINMAYMRGAKKRIEMVLDERYDFAITSKYAALSYKNQNKNIDIVTEFGNETYVSRHIMITANRNFTSIENGMKVGVDRDSIDQLNLTLYHTRNKDVELVNVNYNLIIQSLLNGTIDVAIWNGDELRNKYTNLYFKDLDGYSDDNTIAVLLVKKDRHDLKKLIADSLDVKEVVNLQRQVIENKIIPNY